jgi:hypothetical protein
MNWLELSRGDRSGQRRAHIVVLDRRPAVPFTHHNTPLRGHSGEDPERRSVRVAVAAELLRRGRMPASVAETTGVPFALVEWLADHPAPPPENDHARRHTANDDTIFTVPFTVSPSSGAVGADLGVSPRRTRRRFHTIAPFAVGWLLNCLLSVIALIYRQPVVGTIAVALSTVLVVVSTIVIATHRPRRQRPRRR